MPRNFKRCLILSDTHCGHVNGIAPQGWNVSGRGADYRAEMIAALTQDIENLRPLDAIIFNGDLCDGPGKDPGEHVSDDPNDQVLIAMQFMVDVIGNQKRAPACFATAGTPFHTTVKGINLEHLAVQHAAAQTGVPVLYKNQHMININGRTIHCRHHIGNGQLINMPPSLPRQKLTNMLLAERGMQPVADVFIRSHVHRFLHCADATANFIITPALQGSTDYGALRCDSVIDVGFLWLDIFDDGEVLCRKQLYRPRALAMEVSAL
jgi:hypothetical protein